MIGSRFLPTEAWSESDYEGLPALTATAKSSCCGARLKNSVTTGSFTAANVGATKEREPNERTRRHVGEPRSRPTVSSVRGRWVTSRTCVSSEPDPACEVVARAMIWLHTSGDVESRHVVACDLRDLQSRSFRRIGRCPGDPLSELIGELLNQLDGEHGRVLGTDVWYQRDGAAGLATVAPVVSASGQPQVSISSGLAIDVDMTSALLSR